MRRTTALLCLAAAVPFAPAAWQIARAGIPDILFTGDAAALELRVLYAARGIQLLGPYSQFGWSHPGPAYFYLALPFYEVLGERGTALNVFALTVNLCAAIGLVLSVRRLFDAPTALAAAALVAVFVLIGAPYLAANEWNPILPILPLGLLTLLTIRFSIGENALLPAMTFLASAIVQTHVGYGVAVAVLAFTALVARRGSPAVPRRVWGVALAVGAVCWALPFYEAFTSRPGNIQSLIAFFAPGNLAEQSWMDAIRAVRDQLAVVPAALAAAFRMTIDASGLAASTLVAIQAAVLTGIVFVSARQPGRPLAAGPKGPALQTLLDTTVIVQALAAVAAVRAIRGEIALYLVAWISVIGLLAAIVTAAWLATAMRATLGSRLAARVVGLSSVVLMGLAVAGSTRAPVYRQRDPSAESLARRVEEFLGTAGAIRPLVTIRSRETWPRAVSVVLHLYKRRLPVAVDDSWAFLVGKPLAAPAGLPPELVFGDHAFHGEAQADRRLSFIAEAGGVYVYYDAKE